MAKAVKGGYQAETQIHSKDVIATEGILIRMTRLTDTSLIVHWFTNDEGLMKTVAKGALRPKSPFAGKLDLFFSGEIGAARARRGELHSLREVRITNWREGLRRGYGSALMAGYFCRLVEMSVAPGQADGEMHDLLRRGLDYLDTEEPGLRAMRHFEKSMTRVIGISGGGEEAAEALREHLGGLPEVRKELLARLGSE